MDGRLWSIIRTPHTSVWRTMVVSRRIYRMVWVKCTTSAECISIRIAESSVMDGWDDRYLAQCRFYFKMVFSEKWRKVSNGVLGGYCRGTDVVWSTCRVLPKKWRWSCVIDHVYGGHVWLTTGSSLENELSPFLEILLKCLTKILL
jgi:hypothetical protein